MSLPPLWLFLLFAVICFSTTGGSAGRVQSPKIQQALCITTPLLINRIIIIILFASFVKLRYITGKTVSELVIRPHNLLLLLREKAMNGGGGTFNKFAFILLLMRLNSSCHRRKIHLHFFCLNSLHGQHYILFHNKLVYKRAYAMCISEELDSLVSC